MIQEVRFYDDAADERLKFAVILSRFEGKWVFCKHRDRDTLEVPGGRREPGEAILETARRELREETGAAAGRFESLGELYPSPGYCGEIIRMYLARDLTFGGTDLDEDEFLNLERVPFETLVQQVLSGEVRDAKTIAAVLKAKVLQGL